MGYRFSPLICALLFVPSFSHATDESAPKELLPLLAPSEKLRAYKVADLNGDGRPDYILILQRQDPNNTDGCIDGMIREAVVAVRTKSGELQIAARNSEIMLCVETGGVFGDPFSNLEAGRGWFRISHTGGGNARWNISSKFRYSSKLTSWILDEESRTYSIHDDKTYRSPRGVQIEFSTYSTPEP